MPKEIIAAGLEAIGIGGGAAVSARAQNRATDVQERANQEAMAFQREQAELAEELYRQQWLEREAGRRALLEKYGITLPEVSAGPPSGPASGGPPPGAAPRGGPPPGAVPPGAIPRGGPPQGGNIGTLAAPQAGGPPAALGSWNDWTRYGLRR